MNERWLQIIPEARRATVLAEMAQIFVAPGAELVVTGLGSGQEPHGWEWIEVEYEIRMQTPYEEGGCFDLRESVFEYKHRIMFPQ